MPHGKDGNGKDNDGGIPNVVIDPAEDVTPRDGVRFTGSPGARLMANFGIDLATAGSRLREAARRIDGLTGHERALQLAHIAFDIITVRDAIYQFQRALDALMKDHEHDEHDKR
jgi:hypothetical protein